MPTQTRCGMLATLYTIDLIMWNKCTRSTHRRHRCSQVITSLLAHEKPDLAVLSGDMVSGFMWDGTPGWFEKRHVPELRNTGS